MCGSLQRCKALFCYNRKTRDVHCLGDIWLLRKNKGCYAIRTCTYTSVFGALLSNSCLVCVPSSSPPCSGSHVSVYCQLGSGPCIVQWLLCIHTYVHTVRRCLYCVHCSVESGTMYIWRTYDSTVHCAVLHTYSICVYFRIYIYFRIAPLYMV